MRRFLLFVSCALALRALAVDNDRRFERIGAAEGLSEPSVQAIAQDRRGFLWFGTAEGLNRFDGTSMVVYRRNPANPATLPSNRVSALLVDAGGTLWVGTRGGGLARFDATTERFETFRFDPNDAASLSQNDVAAMVQDRKGQIWVGTMRGGLNRIDLTNPARPRFIRHAHDAKNAASISDDRTRALLVDRNDRVWIATMSGVNRLENDAFLRYSLTDNEVWSIAQDRDGTIWAGSWGGGLSRLDGERFVSILADPAQPFSLSDNRVMKILEDRDGTLWIGTQSKLNELLPSEKRKEHPRFIRHGYDFDSPYSLSDNYVSAAFEDRDGDLWFGTSGGVNHLDRRHAAFQRLDPDPNDPLRLSPANGVATAIEDRRGVLWLATSKGLDRVVRSGDRFVADTVTHFTRDNDTGFAGESASALLEDRNGTIWIGTLGGGLLAISADEALQPRPKFQRFMPDPANPASLASDAVLSLMEDARGTLWVGTYRGLHHALPGGGFARYRNDRNDDATLSADSIESLAEGRDGTIWVGTYRGLNAFNPNTGRAKRYLPDPLRPRSLPHEFIDDVHVDRNGDLWVATWGGGLARLRKGSEEFDLFGTREGLPSESIEQIAEDESGVLWIATSRGLARFDPRRNAIRVFGARDGLYDDSLNSVSWRRDGSLMIGGGGSLTMFDPRRLGRDDARPPVVLTGLQVLNEPVAIGAGILSKAVGFTEAITLGPRHYTFAVDFAALTYRNPEKLRYAYRLEAFDRDWIPANDRRAAFSNVPPGRYVLRVRAANADGVWSDRPTSMQVTILPPWWKTWWARLAAALLLAGAIVSWPLLRLARERRLSSLLETKVHERTAQLEEANRKLDEASRTDLLTGLPNRRHFLEKADEHLASFRRNGRAFAIALADVDNFKSVNDTRGHDMGDAVLRSVAALFREAVRETDLVARWGGEEFIFLLPETDDRGAIAVAEKARAAVANGNTPLPITVTIGVASIAPDLPLEQCSIRADAALYEGKRSGKNKVVQWTAA
ncbi:MAG TPA: two-component regulator propeller domain-containing protein [Thermoanaerobaculia bacterium]|nr:two-component regulator propeller domain-containing protein [Thermoanaerobaculia bacterium]